MKGWGWFIAIYLFLGGVGAGAYLTSLAAEKGLLGHVPQLKRLGYIISAPIVASGAALLILDLGQGKREPWLLFRLLSNPHSVMSWGTGILSVFIALGLVRGYLAWRQQSAPDWLGYAGGVFAVATAVYTGLLLAAIRAVPFWHNYVLPILFMISALSTGMSATTFLAHFLAREHGHQDNVCLAHVILVGAELVVLSIFFGMISAGMMGPVAAESGAMIMFDQFSLVFWLCLVGIGLVGPLALYVRQYLQSSRIHAAGMAAALDTALASGLDNEATGLVLEQPLASPREPRYMCACDAAVLIGGLSLRCLFVFAALPVWSGLLG